MTNKNRKLPLCPGQILGHSTPVLDIPDQPVLDKLSLVGGCLRLPLRVDAERLRAEVARLEESVWAGTGGRVGVHRVAAALFLRGYAPAEGDKPIEDRPVLDQLPYARSIIEQLIPAPPMRCLLARLPAGATIKSHIDLAPYFAKTLRLHFAVESHERAWMLSGPLTYVMRPGEVWVLNNSATHAVWNEHPTQSRTHMICDFLPTPALLALLASGQRDLGRRIEAVNAHIAALNPADATAGG